MNVSRDELPISISGRWGSRRVCVTECAVVLAAEEVYDHLLAAGATFGPGWRGEVELAADDVRQSVRVEVKRNAVWRNGRVFLKCGHCERRCTRLYMPCLADPLRCRQCWRLTYESSQTHNYRGYGFLSPRMASVMNTVHRRETRHYESLRRWKKRRQLRESKEVLREHNQFRSDLRPATT